VAEISREQGVGGSLATTELVTSNAVLALAHHKTHTATRVTQVYFPGGQHGWKANR